MMKMVKCNECGSENVIKAGHNVWRVIDKKKHLRHRVQKWQCNDCGKRFTVDDSAGQGNTK